MDPLSLAFGVAGLMSLTLELTKLVSTYTGSVRQASTESQELAVELSALSHVLEKLERFLSNQDAVYNTFDNTSILYSTVHTCHGKLNLLKSILEKYMKTSEGRKWYRSLVWPLKGVNHVQTVGTLRRCVQIFQFSLTVDGW